MTAFLKRTTLIAAVVSSLLVGETCGCVERPAPSEKTGGDTTASSELRFVRRVPEKGPPEAFTLHPDSYLASSAFLGRFAPSLWSLSSSDELRLVNALSESNGYTYEHYQQFHAGYPVENGQLQLQVSPRGKVISAVGKPRGGLDKVSTEVRVSETSAVERARRRAASACSLPDPLAFVEAPPPRLMVSDRQGRLVWNVAVVVAKPKWVEWGVQVDAKSGDVLYEWGGVGVGGQMPGCLPSR